MVSVSAPKKRNVRSRSSGITGGITGGITNVHASNSGISGIGSMTSIASSAGCPRPGTNSITNVEALAFGQNSNGNSNINAIDASKSLAVSDSAFHNKLDKDWFESTHGGSTGTGGVIKHVKEFERGMEQWKHRYEALRAVQEREMRNLQDKHVQERKRLHEQMPQMPQM